MSDQPKPMFPKLQVFSPMAIRFLMAAMIGGSLLGLAGLTLTGTMIALAVATPVLVLLSPVLIPTVVALFLVTTGFMFSGGLLAASMASMACAYRYLTGKSFPWVGELNYARMKIANKAREVKERAKENGQIVQCS